MGVVGVVGVMGVVAHNITIMKSFTNDAKSVSL